MVNDANMANSDSDKTPLFLIPGWGTDWRLWKHQLEADLGPVEPIVPKWLEPEPRESLSNYAARLAKSIDPGRPCYLVGLSFGGMIAVEMAQHLDVKACVLIASIPSGDRLPRRYHIFRPLIRWIPSAFWYLPRGVVRLHRALCKRRISENLRIVYDMFLDAPVPFHHWTAYTILRWQRSDGPIPCPMYHLHGDADWILPIRYVEPDTVLPGAGHCLSLTRPKEVNEYIAKVVRKGLD